MAALQVLEHQRVRVAEARGPGEIALTENDARLLERLMPKLPRGVCRWEHKAVRFSQYCGVICLGATVVEILPKIFGKEQDPGACREVLIGMLNESRELEPATSGSAPIRLQQAVLLDAFVLAFCRDLETQLARGLLRCYVSRLENISVIRGKLRIDLQFKHNLVHRERLYCEYDELSADIRLNQVIKGVLRKLARLPLGPRALKHLRELLLRFDEVTDVKPTVAMLDEVAPDRTIARYEAVIRQCRWFLGGIYPDVAVGATDAAALLFDMNKLFEACVTRAARRETWKRGFRLQAQGPRKWFARQVETGLDMFTMKPDVTIMDNRGTVLLVADAKWKMLDEEEAKLGVAESDMYQLAAYAARYGAARATLIYPAQRAFSRQREIAIYSPSVSVQLIPFDVVQRSLAHMKVTQDH